MDWRHHLRAIAGALLTGLSALVAGLVAFVAIVWAALYLTFSSRVQLPFETALGLTIAFLAAVVWIVHLLVVQRRARSAGAATLALLATLAGVWLLNAARDRARIALRYERSAQEMLSVQVSFDPPVFACDSDRDWRGEGYSFAVFDLPAELEARFRGTDRSYLRQSPRIPKGWGPHFGAVAWRATPVPDAYTPHLELALPDETGCNSCQPDCSTLAAQLEAARHAATSPGSYVSFIHRYPDGPRPNDIVLFLVSLDESRIYFANSNR